MNDSLVRASTTASSLEAEQDSGGGPRFQEAMRDTTTQTRSERVSKFSNDSLLVGVNIPRSDKDILKLKELMELCTILQSRVLALEHTKATQANEIDSLKKRVKKLKKKQRSRTHKLKRLYKVGLTARIESFDDDVDLGEDASKQERISDIDSNKGITLVSTHDDAKMFDTDKDLHSEEVFVAKQNENVVKKEVDATQVQVTTAATTTTISIDEVTLAKALAELKHKKPKAKAKGIDKGKDKIIEEPVKFKKKDQIQLDEEVALKLQVELQVKFEKEQRLAKEQQELNDEEKAILFMQLLEKRMKFFVSNRVEEKRNKPPTQAQQRKIMCTYLKNMEGKKLTDLKNESFDSIQKMFDRAFKRVNTFVDFRTELVEESSKKAEAEVMEQESSKRAGTELEQENSKQKIVDDKKIAELKQLVKIILGEEGVAIDAIPLVVKPPSIVDWKIQKDEKKSYYNIIRADGSSKIYLVFSHMLKDFDREDVKTLWKLVKAKYGSTRPEGDYERVLWGDLKVMFEPHIEDKV
nr:hypothetical protein [Tanacetum cinerariifolium]